MDRLALRALETEAGGWNRHGGNAFVPAGRARQYAVLLNLVSGEGHGFLLSEKHSIP